MKNKPRGFIALISAVIISAILLQIAVTASQSGFFHREAVLDTELKARSSATADACADEAFLLVANNPLYAGLTTLHLNSYDQCRVTVSGLFSKSIRVQATSSNIAVTNLQIQYNATTSQILYWQEVAVY